MTWYSKLVGNSDRAEIVAAEIKIAMEFHSHLTSPQSWYYIVWKCKNKIKMLKKRKGLLSGTLKRAA